MKFDPRKMITLALAIAILSVAAYLLVGRLGGTPAPVPVKPQEAIVANTTSLNLGWTTGSKLAFTYCLGGVALALMAVGLVMLHPGGGVER